jgi:hypothetical protein
MVVGAVQRMWKKIWKSLRQKKLRMKVRFAFCFGGVNEYVVYFSFNDL